MIPPLAVFLVTLALNAGCKGEENNADSNQGGDSDHEEEVDLNGPDYPNDDLLRVNHIQAKGTHNSYHIKNPDYDIAQLDFTMAPLDVQLEEQGVRQFELDVQYSEEGGFTVFHLQSVDELSTCHYLTDCLATMKTWSDAHTGHHILFVLIEPKDENKVGSFAEEHNQLEDEILSIWPRSRILTPDDVRGSHEDIRSAIMEDGWPTLGGTRDKIMFVLFDSGQNKTDYLEGHPNLEDRLMFTRESDMENPNAAFFWRDDPVENADRIREVVEAGFILRSRADANCIEARGNDRSRGEAALENGATMISTDFPAAVEDYDYWFDMESGSPSRCNPVSAPEFCSATDVENLE